MKTANKVGVAALSLLVVSAGISFGRLMEQPALAFVEITSQWGGILLLIYAGIRGARWWLAIPLVLIMVWLWAILQGH
jgi:hypothetical protein